jgi:hypothetical protein
MAEETNQKQNTEANSRGPKKSRKRRSKRPQRKDPPVICSICGKNIESITQAIGGPDKDQVSHFDCILRQLEEEEKLIPGQKVSYIGNGTFAVIEYKNKNYTGGFTVLKRIVIENKEHNEQVKRLVSARKDAAELFKKR